MSTVEKHNLNIHMYSFEELLGLFDLSYDITQQDMKRAKNKVLMLHPDKSRLPADYFLFYKKALDIIFNYYQNNTKINQTVSKEKIDYSPVEISDMNKSTTKKIKSTIGEMDPQEFQRKFNESFEKNMKKEVTKVNEWFSKEDPVYDIKEKVLQNNMGTIMENIKKQNQGIVRYQGVQNMYSSGGTNLYDDDDADEEGRNNQYVTSDPFSKLKYDDLRKVHKEQTIFAVSESDFKKVEQYKNIEHLNQVRNNKDSLKPLDKPHAERILLEQDRILKEKMAQKQHKSFMKTEEYTEKNKTILSSFLQLKNGV
jgi:hypothetical protein